MIYLVLLDEVNDALINNAAAFILYTYKKTETDHENTELLDF